MIRIALIGCGEHSRESHAAPLARYAAEHPGEISLAAVCDLDLRRAEAFRRDFGFERAYASLDELLASGGFDACVSVMPTDHIAAVGCTLLERRIPCVVEKPLGSSLEDAERLAHVARETGTPHMVSVNRRFMPYLERAAEWARGVGPLRYVRASMVRHARREPDFIWSTAIHAVDALRFLAGEIHEVETEVIRTDGPTAIWYVLSFRFEGGAVGRLEVLPTGGMVEESYELFGENYRARVVAGSGTQRSLRLWRGGVVEADEIADENEPVDLRNGSFNEVVEFVRALREGSRPKPEIEDVLPSVRAVFSIAESASAKVAR
jgi:myo-inositol 2-dehydrogenase / D-chiro-inositol 1-dehydrogenase